MRPGKPYPATFRISVDPPGVEPGFPVCRTGVLPLDDEPVLLSGPDGNRTRAPTVGWSTDFAGVSRLPWNMPARLRQGSVRESNPVFVLTMDVCCRSTYRPSSDPGWTRTIVFLVVTQVSSPLDYGIALKVTEVGVEPTGTRPSTSPLCQFAYPVASGGSGCCTRRARLMRPHWALAHPRSSCRSRYRAGHAGLMGAGWAPAAPAMMSSQGESRTPTPMRARRSERRVSTSSTTWLWSVARTNAVRRCPESNPRRQVEGLTSCR